MQLPFSLSKCPLEVRKLAAFRAVRQLDFWRVAVNRDCEQPVATGYSAAICASAKAIRRRSSGAS